MLFTEGKAMHVSIEEYEELIRFSSSPIQVSLLKLSKPEINKAALESYLGKDVMDDTIHIQYPLPPSLHTPPHIPTPL